MTELVIDNLAGGGMRHRGLRSPGELAASRPHGDRLRYIAGCRCFKCRRANSDYERQRKEARAAGDWNGIVSAAEARVHLVRLRKSGIGSRAVAEATDIPRSVILSISSGAKIRIRARTANRILAVNDQCRADHAFVKATRTWQYINRLLEEGFTKADLARLLGCKTPALQISKTRVTVRTAHRVAALYRRYTR